MDQLISTAFGFVLGLATEPVKSAVKRWNEVRTAKQEMYRDLANYVALLEACSSDPVLAHHIPPQIIHPNFEVIDWYIKSRMDLVFRVDPLGALRTTCEAIRRSCEAHKSDGPEKLHLLIQILLGWVAVIEKEMDFKFFRDCVHKASRGRRIKDLITRLQDLE